MAGEEGKRIMKHGEHRDHREFLSPASSRGEAEGSSPVATCEDSSLALGMTNKDVTPAQAGVWHGSYKSRMPAFAGMTGFLILGELDE